MRSLTDDNLLIAPPTPSQHLHQKCLLRVTVASQQRVIPAHALPPPLSLGIKSNVVSDMLPFNQPNINEWSGCDRVTKAS